MQRRLLFELIELNNNLLLHSPASHFFSNLQKPLVNLSVGNSEKDLELTQKYFGEPLYRKRQAGGGQPAQDLADPGQRHL